MFHACENPNEFSKKDDKNIQNKTMVFSKSVRTIFPSILQASFKEHFDFSSVRSLLHYTNCFVKWKFTMLISVISDLKSQRSCCT